MNNDEMTNGEKVMAVLDRDNPGWDLNWADQQDLLDFAKGQVTLTNLRARVLRRLFPLINAAIEAGIVTLPDD